MVHEVAVDGHVNKLHFVCVIDRHGCRMHPVLVLWMLCLLEENNIRGHFSQGIFTKGTLGQSYGPKEFCLVSNVLPHRGVHSIQKKTADYKGSNASITELIDTFR